MYASIFSVVPRMFVLEVVYKFNDLVRLKCDVDFLENSFVSCVPFAWHKLNGKRYVNASLLCNRKLTSKVSRHVNTLLFESVSLSDTSMYASSNVDNEITSIEKWIKPVMFELISKQIIET